MRSRLLTTALCATLISASSPALTAPIWKKVSPSGSGGGGGGATCYYTTAFSCGDGFNRVPGDYVSSTTGVDHFICCNVEQTSVIPDETPRSVDFTNVSAIAGNSIETNIEQVVGITSATVSTTGDGNPEFRICTDAICSNVTTNWTSSGTVNEGEYVQVRNTAPPFGDDAFNATVSIGSLSDSWTTETLGWYTFVSSTSVRGYQVNGLSGGDSICQSNADDAGLPGTYKAWLGVPGEAPSTRFENVNTSDPFYRIDGVKVADNWSDLTDGTIDNANRKQPNGSNWGAYVWTSVNSDGTPRGSAHCDYWDTSNYSGSVGYASSQTATWTQTNTTTDCANDPRPLYCFQTAK